LEELQVDLEASRALIDALDKKVSELNHEKSCMEGSLAMHDMDHEKHCERFEILDIQVLELQEQNQLLEQEKAGFCEQRLS
jgi:hypothetical protein